MLVKPTNNWRVPQLKVPGVGTLKRQDIMDVPKEALTFLEAQRLVTRVKDRDLATSETTPVTDHPEPTAAEPVAEEELVSTEPGVDINTKAIPEDAIAKAVEFLNTSNAEDINAIRYIGRQTVADILEERKKAPLDWEGALTLLSERQAEALIEALG